MITWLDDQEGSDLAWPVWLILCLYGVIGMTDLINLFALPAMIGRLDVLAWWVTFGTWFPAGGRALVLVAVTASLSYPYVQDPRTRAIVTVTFGAVAVACLFLAAGSRIEVRADDLRVTSDDWGRADVIYRVEHASQMVVGCDTGRRRRVYPSLQVLFSDGTWLQLAPLVSTQGNRSGRRDGLQLAERFDAFLSARGNRYRSPYVSLSDICAHRVSQRLGGDAARVEHLFRPATIGR